MAFVPTGSLGSSVSLTSIVFRAARPQFAAVLPRDMGHHSRPSGERLLLGVAFIPDKTPVLCAAASRDRDCERDRTSGKRATRWLNMAH